MLAGLRAARRWPPWARVSLTAIGLVSLYLFQIPLETEVPGEPFLLFFLVVMGSALAFGQGVGLFGVGLSALLSVFFFEPGTLALHHAADLVRIELYALLAAGSVFGLARLADALMAADDAARALERSERANSVLLRELAHRVANNFAAVASLIRRRAQLVDDQRAKSVLNEAVEQVMVLARVHSRLRTESDDVALDSKAFLQELCDDLKVLVAPGEALAIECTAVSRCLSVAQAIPVGLIVNELVTNAIKHAFPAGRRGLIRVGLEQAGDLLCLSVEDNGVGLGQRRSRGTGLGQDLVRALCQQLGGKLEVGSAQGGTRFSLTFPDAGREARAPAPAPSSMMH
jgi:two-component sensor histidine kinase